MVPQALAQQFKEPIWVTIAYIGLYYCFLFGQALTKMYVYHFTNAAVIKDKKLSYSKFKYEFKGPLALTLDRTVGNTLEQAIPFLLGLWLSAVFSSPHIAAKFGWLYIASRLIYPFCFYGGLPWLLMSTVPGYLFITMLWKDVVIAAL
jgi:hypothetical protein